MKLLKKLLLPLLVAAAPGIVRAADTGKAVVAYVTSWSDIMPDPSDMTHINYAFGHVNETFDGVSIDNEARLREIVSLKRSAPDLKVALSIGGWGSGRFSEMAGDDRLRASFAADCARVADEYGLDGIDIDWEYPGSSAAGISSSDRDTENFTKLMRDIRRAIGPDRLLTMATAASAEYIDFKGVLPYVDFVNVMSYDMANAPKHHAGLYPSDNTPDLTCDSAVKAHLAAGVPAGKLVMGMPFYGRGGTEMRGCDFGRITIPEGYEERFDPIAMVPYIVNPSGELVLGFDNETSIAAKCDYILANDLFGAMYWEYSGDDAARTLSRTVASRVKGKPNKPKALVLNEGGGQHGPFTAVAMKWLHEYADSRGFAVTELRNADPITEAFLDGYALVIQLDFPPYTWPKAAEEAFIGYIDEGKGGWIGFHHATLLGEFDGYGLWEWFSDFMGGITFKNYIAPLADGTVTVEEPAHPVMAGLPATFTLRDDEWYTYDRSPRPHVQVLAHVDEESYSPASDIRMGDHPVIWTNPAKKARNVYIQPGHSPVLFESEAFVTLFSNAIDWAMNRDGAAN